MYKTIYTEVEVDVDLSDFETDDLIEELESRGEVIESEGKPLIVAIWEKRRLGQDYQRELDDLIFNVVGRIV